MSSTNNSGDVIWVTNASIAGGGGLHAVDVHHRSPKPCVNRHASSNPARYHAHHRR